MPSRWKLMFVLLCVLSLCFMITVSLAAEGRGGSITLAMGGAVPPSPDPHDSRSMGHHTVSAMISDPLLKWQDDDFAGVLAKSWDISPCGLTYTFYLQENVPFHNGVILTAEAVKKNYERITNPEDPLPIAGDLADIESVEIVDDLTFKFHLKSLNPDFLARLMYFWISEPGSWENLGPGQYVAGSGAFRPVAYAEDQYLRLEKFEDYWAQEPYLDEITIRPIPEADTQIIELETGGLDLLLYAPPMEANRLEGLGFNVIPFVRVNFSRVVFNFQTMEELELRKAISYAIDREAIRDVAYAGLGEPMSTLGIQGSWLYNEEVGGYYYDPDKANAILDAAGWEKNRRGIREMDGEPIRLHLPTRGDDEAWLRSTQMIQQMLEDVGIDSYITTADSQTFYTQVRVGEYDLAWWLSNAPPEPPIAHGNLRSASYWNVTQLPVDHPLQQKFDELDLKAMSTVDFDVRAQYYGEMQQIHYDEAVEALGLWIEQIHVANSALKGLHVPPTGVVYDAFLWRLDQ